MFTFFPADPYQLDWGSLTPDGYDENKKEILHIYNIDISTSEKRDRCIVFIVGKMIWSHKQIPQGVNQKVILDLRGQPLIYLERARQMKEIVLSNLERLKLFTSTKIEILI